MSQSSTKKAQRASSASTLASPSPSGRPTPTRESHHSDSGIATCLAGCGKPVTPASKALACEFCNQWCHLDCDTRVPSKMYAEVSKCEAIVYMCRKCRIINPSVPLSMSPKYGKQKMDSFEGQLRTLENSIKNIQEKLVANTIPPLSSIPLPSLHSSDPQALLPPNKTYKHTLLSGEAKLHLRGDHPTPERPPIQQQTPKYPFNPKCCVVLHDFKTKSLLYNHSAIRHSVSAQLEGAVIQYIRRYDTNDPKLIVQFQRESSAEKLLQQWSADKEGCKIRQPKAHKQNLEAIARGVPKDMSEETLLEIAKEEFPSCHKVIRFMKNQKPIPLVKFLFTASDDFDKATQGGLYVKEYCLKLQIEKAIQKPRVPQCYNCLGFGHVSKHCKRQKVCSHCANTITEENNHEDCNLEMKCCNCKGTNHSSRDINNCPKYNDLLKKLSDRIANYQS